MGALQTAATDPQQSSAGSGTVQPVASNTTLQVPQFYRMPRIPSPIPNLNLQVPLTSQPLSWFRHNKNRSQWKCVLRCY